MGNAQCRTELLHWAFFAMCFILWFALLLPTFYGSAFYRLPWLHGSGLVRALFLCFLTFVFLVFIPRVFGGMEQLICGELAAADTGNRCGLYGSICFYFPAGGVFVIREVRVEWGTDAN